MYSEELVVEIMKQAYKLLEANRYPNYQPYQGSYTVNLGPPPFISKDQLMDLTKELYEFTMNLAYPTK